MYIVQRQPSKDTIFILFHCNFNANLDKSEYCDMATSCSVPPEEWDKRNIWNTPNRYSRLTFLFHLFSPFHTTPGTEQNTGRCIKVKAVKRLCPARPATDSCWFIPHRPPQGPSFARAASSLRPTVGAVSAGLT